MSEKRLIDANALIDIIEERRYQQHMPVDWANGMHSAKMIILAAPTIDAVEVVRCEDCRHLFRYLSSDMDETFSDGRVLYICNKQGREHYTIAEGYCECGERRQVCDEGYCRKCGQKLIQKRVRVIEK